MERRRHAVPEARKVENMEVAARKGWKAVFAGGRWDSEDGAEAAGWVGDEETIPFISTSAGGVVNASRKGHDHGVSRLIVSDLVVALNTALTSCNSSTLRPRRSSETSCRGTGAWAGSLFLAR